MKKLNMRPLLVLLAVLLLAAAVAPAALASGPILTGKSCSLSVSFAPEGKAAEGVRFSVWRVADVNVACEFTPTDSYADFSPMAMLADPDAESYRILSTMLPGYIAENAIAPDAEAGTDAQGMARFAGLPVGLYLVVGEVYAADRQFHTPEAFMVALPDRLEDDSWLYDVAVEAKYTSVSDSEDVDISVVKIWSDSATNAHSTDYVLVCLYDGDILYDKQMLSKENNWTYTWKGLYGGTTWNLSELKYPSGYTPQVERRGNLFVVTNTKPADKTPGTLPQTGQLWWPVPLLLAGGVLLLVLGFVKRKRT